MSIKVTRAIARQFATAYISGRSATSIAEEFKVAPQTVVTHLIMHGVEIRSRGFSPIKRGEREGLWKAIADGYQNGKSCPELSKEFSVSVSAVRQAILREGVEMRKRGEKSPQFLQKNAERNSAIADGYRNGKSVRALMEEFDLSEKSVWRAITDHGAGRRKGVGK